MAWFRRDPRIRWFHVGVEGPLGAVDEIDRVPGGRVSETRVWKYQATGNDFVMTLDLDRSAR